MKPEPDYLSTNKSLWNQRTQVHVKSDFYDIPGFLNGKKVLNEPELQLLGDITGKKIMHLQCHFGQDSIELARMGGSVTGIDLSDEAIREARALNEKAGTSVQFICCDLYDTPVELHETFDMVFSSYGTIAWLPDLDKWASVIAKCLKPGGEFVFAEFHPVVWMFDDDFNKVGYNYFNTGPILENSEGTYTDRNAEIHSPYYCWNHSLSETLQSLIDNGLNIMHFREYDYSPYNVFRHSYEPEPGKFRIVHMENKIPMMFTLNAIKPE
ncbi:MAG: class I SAM-dependent methyltransferase [Bacteroidetes bacterium]|nr:class I SAM-dependent methyltransferase [Bacteroidota bacterium]